MMYILYLHDTLSIDRYYIGYSHDPFLRLEKHNLGATTSTRNGRPWILVYHEEYEDKSSAIRRELEIKKMKSRKFIEKLIISKTVG